MPITKNYSIYEDRIVAFTLGDLIAGIKEAYEEGYEITDPYKVEKAGPRMRVGIIQKEEPQEPEIPLEQVTEEILNAFETFPELRDFAKQYGITGRSVVGIKFKFKELQEKS